MKRTKLIIPKISILVTSFFVIVALIGCAPKAYVDPNLPRVTYNEIESPQDPMSLRVSFDFQTNGKHNKRATKQVSQIVLETLNASNIFSSVELLELSDEANLDIVMNNVADLGKAIGKGFVTGLTFGIAGSLVTDNYVFRAIYKTPGKEPVTLEYNHAIHSTIGNKRGPDGLKPMTLKEAIEDVTEQLVLNMLRDLRAGGHL